jgi:hypothetical protein
MDRLDRGYAVFGVDDRRLGQVGRINACCFEVGTAEHAELHVLPSAIFNVDRRRVTLVCSNEEVGRYLCTRKQHLSTR